MGMHEIELNGAERKLFANVLTTFGWEASLKIEDGAT